MSPSFLVKILYYTCRPLINKISSSVCILTFRNTQRPVRILADDDSCWRKVYMCNRKF